MKNWMIIGVVGVILGVLLGVIVYLLLSKTAANTATSDTSSITGVMNINGVIPQGSVLTLSQKTALTGGKFRPFATSLVPKDGIEWIFSGTKTNTSYEIEAVLTKGEKVIAQSSPIGLTAPAHGETITLNIEAPAQAGNAVISGTITLNGYVPQGATITVEGRKLGATSWSTVATNLPAINNQFMSYTTATSGQEYEVRGFLVSNNLHIGGSTTLTLTAPAENEVLTINSTAQPPATPAPTQTAAGQLTPTPAPTTSAISGSIDFNGQAPANTRITIFTAPAGSTNYQLAVDNITPVDGTTWTWNGAVAGHSYNMIAILKQKQSNGTDQDLSNANTLTLAAPATNQVFTINSGFSLPAAGGTISVACGTYNGNNQSWGATISFTSIQNAQSYWYQIGTTNGGVQLTNFTQNASSNQTQSFTYTLQNGVTYFARYAYSTIPNQNASSNQFSPFSQATPLICSH